jgi:hypothetical protein
MQLTDADLDVLYTLQHVPRHERPTAHNRRLAALARRGLVRQGAGCAVLTERGRKAYQDTVRQHRAQEEPLSVAREAVMMAIRQEPRYRFVGSELALARRMWNDGLLRDGPEPGRFQVTAKAYLRYRGSSSVIC